MVKLETQSVWIRLSVLVEIPLPAPETEEEEVGFNYFTDEACEKIDLMETHLLEDVEDVFGVKYVESSGWDYAS